ncbi:UV radiation resistance-associated protein [Armadillidium nasatum]|uniref:UV radiation resistance-associated protein n=1 Tax=Armadillidium nasatum TaxID=96803 RepID=A0A5N5TI87_9CRUS|nr:UV radiation resistance-associated protein [Armadillidium nasatum]
MKSHNTLKNLDLNARENVSNTLFLIYSQASLRLRHLNQIVGYNLSGLPDSSSLFVNPLPSFLPQWDVKNGYYFTLEATQNGVPEYSSSLQPSTSPNWESFDCKEIFPVHFLSLKGIIVRVWLQLKEDKKLITSWGVNFSGLVPLGSKIPTSTKFPPNTLLFKLRGRYYTSYDCILKDAQAEENPFELHEGFNLALSETKPSYSVTSLCRLHSSKRELRKLENRKEELKKMLEVIGVKSQSEFNDLEKKVEDLKIKVRLLMEQVEVELNKLRNIQTLADNLDSENQEKGVELLEGYQNLNRSLAALRIEETRLIEENESLRTLSAQVRERRKYLLSQLNFIFPIEKINKSGVKYSICDIPLPDAESYSGHPDQSLSAALGFVAQLFVKIAFLVNIPLKYPVTLRGSLSSIADLTSTQLLDVETQFPLYTRGKEREKLHFNYGVFLLNKNIAQLRWNCGLPTSDLRRTLYNVLHLLRSLYDKSSPSRAIMPDTIVSSLVFPVSLRKEIQTPEKLLEHHSSPRLSPTAHREKDRHSLLHEQSLPNLLLRKNNSLVDDSFLCTVSDTDSKIEKLLRDGSQSEGEANKMDPHLDLKLRTKDTVFSETLLENANKLKHTSFSLDQGINFIKSEYQDCDFTENSSSSLNIVKVNSGSFPSLSKNSTDDNKSSLVLSRVHDQTTQLLRSWHESDPSPYHSLIDISSSTEKIANSNLKLRSVSEPNSSANSNGVLCNSQKSSSLLCNQNHNGTDLIKILPSNSEINCVLVENEKKLENDKLEDEPKKIPSEKLVKELGMSLEDLELDDDSFLKDVASRTANLASQNCSFKFSFNKSSIED